MTARFCTVCTAEITDPARLRRQSPYCGEACRKIVKNEARAAQALKECRLCSRRFYKPRAQHKPCATGAQMDLMEKQT